MCRLLGIKTNRTVDLTFSLLDADNSLVEQSGSNPDGWGVAAWNGEQWRVRKRPEMGAADEEYHDAAETLRGTAFVCHVRQASEGPRSTENTHPFQHRRWVFAHNGTIRGSEKLLPRIPDHLRAQVRGQTDSERFFYLVLGLIERRFGDLDGDHAPGEVLPALAEAEAVAKDVASPIRGLNFLLSDGERLYAHRRSYADGSGHQGPTLFWLDRRDQARQRPDGFRSQETRAMLDSKALHREKALLVASERLTADENWEEVDDGAFLCFTRNLKVRW